MPNEPGYVYILTNPSFKENWVKIGRTSRPVDERSDELDNTSVPLPFKVYATLKTSKFEVAETVIHRMIDRLTDLRIRQNREFFNIQPEVALAILKDLAMLLSDAEITGPEQSTSQGEEEGSCQRRPNFKFSMVGIPIGAKLIFTPANIEVTVVSDDQIQYDERIYKLSPFVGTFMPKERRTQSGQYQGPKYFTYNGEVLDDMRTRMERENN